jgi:hypothetical protein
MEREIFTIFALMLAAIGLVNLVVFVAALRRHGGRRTMCCGGCGYDVAGLANLQCPECGGLLRRVGIPSPALRRAFATWFIASVAIVTVAIVTLVGFVFGSMELDASYPRSAQIIDRREAFSVATSVVPDEMEDRRVAIVFREGVLRSGLPASAYPMVEGYHGAILLMTHTKGGSVSSTAAAAAAAQKDPSVPLLQWEGPLATGVIGNALRIEDPKDANTELIVDWIESLDLEWQHPATRFTSSTYDASVSVPRNLAPILLRSIQATPGQGITSLRTPLFTGRSSGSMRSPTQQIERAAWVDYATFGAFAMVNIAWWGIVALWAVRRRRRIRALPREDDGASPC